jgi:hypothetical protein
MRVRVPGRLPSLVFGVVAAVLALAAGASAGSAQVQQGCETPVYKNGLDVVFGRYSTKAGADRRTAEVKRLGFANVQTAQESCKVWKSALRGIESYSSAVGVQSEARRVKYYPTIECMVAQEIGQIQAIFGTRATMDELAGVISTAAKYGYVGLKTKPAPCGGYQAYVAGFTSKAQATDFAKTASERSGLDVFVIKA